MPVNTVERRDKRVNAARCWEATQRIPEHSPSFLHDSFHAAPVLNYDAAWCVFSIIPRVQPVPSGLVLSLQMSLWSPVHRPVGHRTHVLV